MTPELVDKIIKFQNREYVSVFQALSINLDFQKYRYFTSNRIVLFEIHSDYYIEYDVWAGTSVKVHKDFYYNHHGQLEDGTLSELLEDEWLVMQIK